MMEDIAMQRNAIRVVCNPYTNKMSYYFRNEIGEWDVLSSNSPLSRRDFTNTSIGERSLEILCEIDEIYNRKNKGVDILFEGTAENFELIQKTITDSFADRDISCRLGTTKIAVVGKKSVGKTFLIEGLEDLQDFKYSKTKEKEFVKYTDECNHAEWFEVMGIDLGKDNVDRAFETVKKLSEEGLSAVIYCISATTGRIEEIEKELIRKIADGFAELKVMIVLTMCYKEDVQEAIDEIERVTNQVKIVPALAKEYKTGFKDASGNPLTIAPFGLEDISLFVFGGR